MKETRGYYGNVIYSVSGNTMWAKKYDICDDGIEWMTSPREASIVLQEGDVFDFEYGKKLLDAKLAVDKKKVKELINGESKKLEIIDCDFFTLYNLVDTKFAVICNNVDERKALAKLISRCSKLYTNNNRFNNQWIEYVQKTMNDCHQKYFTCRISNATSEFWLHGYAKSPNLPSIQYCKFMERLRLEYATRYKNSSKFCF